MARKINIPILVRTSFDERFNSEKAGFLRVTNTSIPPLQSFHSVQFGGMTKSCEKLERIPMDYFASILGF